MSITRKETMTTEKAVEQIEKLIDEKLRVAAILQSKSLGDQKEFFLNESRRKVEQIKTALLEALQNP
jgi:hypothetical protein